MDDATARVIEFFGCLRHSKGEWAGKPFTLEPWQTACITDLFGTVVSEGIRQYRTAYIEVPRKNGKSTISAGIALYLLLADREPGAEVYAAAADRDQAAIVFNQAKEMVESSPILAKRCKVMKRVIEVPATGSVFRVLSSDAPTKHGLNAHGIIFDELHAQPNRELWDVLTTSVGSRRQPLTVAITTAGFDKHSICWEQHDYAAKVRDGIIKDPQFYPLVFAADEKDDWKTPETWKKANPSYGVTIKEDYFFGKVLEAVESPAKENAFRRLHLNQWTEQDVRWISMDAWKRCNLGTPDSELVGRECWIGLDLASTIDIAAACLLFNVDGRKIARWLFWVPEENAAKRERKDRVPYLQWIKQGLIKATSGSGIDYDVIRADINELREVYNIREIGIDKWNATQLAMQLESDGFTVLLYSQDYGSMNDPSKQFEKSVVEGEFDHGGNAVASWMAGNVTIEQDSSNRIRPSKKKSTEKIDGIVAAIMAIGREMLAPAEDKCSVEVW